MDLRLAVTGLLAVVDTVPEAAMAHQEVAMGLEEVSVVVLRLLVGMEEDVVGMVLLEWDLGLVDRLHQDMEPTHTTDLRVEWRLSTDNVHNPCKTNLWLGVLRPAMTLLSARPLRWTSAPEAHQVRFLNKLRLTV